MAPRAAILGYMLTMAAACGERPPATDTDGSTGPAPSTGEPTTSTGEPTPTSTDTSATSETADVTTSEPLTTTGEPVMTTGEPGETTSGPGETTGTTTSEPVETTGTSTGEPGETTGTSGPDETTGTGETDTGDPTPACPPPCGRTVVHQGDLIIEAGDSTAELACVTRVTGEIQIIGAFDEAALAGLSGLAQVDGQLLIRDNELLTGLAPFACLREVDKLQLMDLPNLVDVSALSGLNSVRLFGMYRTGASTLPELSSGQLGLQNLQLFGNKALKDLTPLATWIASDVTFEVWLDDLPALESVAALTNLLADSADTEQFVRLYDLPKLTSLAGLEPLVEPHALALIDLPLISNLSPLAQLERAEELTLVSLPQVKSLTGLGKVTQLGSLILGGCISGPGTDGMAGLTSLAGLDSLAQLDVLGIANNSKLSSLKGAPALKGKLQQLHLVDNPQLDQADADAFIAQLGQAPEMSCLGDWDTCQCLFLPPP